MASENQKYKRCPFSIGLVVVKIRDRLADCWEDDVEDVDEEDVNEHSTFCIRHSVATSIDNGHKVDAGLETSSSFLKLTYNQTRLIKDY